MLMLSEEQGSRDLSMVLEALDTRADELAARSYADGTRKAYGPAWAGYCDWCRELGADPLDGNPETVRRYVAFLTDADVAASTLRVHLAAIRLAHMQAGVTLDTTAPALRMTVQGAVRTLGTRALRKAAAAVPAVLRALLATREPLDTAAGARDRALLLIGFGAALRRAELVGLQIGDVVHEQGRGLRVLVRRSKTDQEGAGVELRIASNPFDPEFCSSVAYEAWMKHRPNAADGGERGCGLFCRIRRWGCVGEPLSAQSVALIVKDAAREAGLNQDDFSGHSLRRGMATAAAQAGVGLVDLMRHTRHKKAETAMAYIDEAEGWSKTASAAVFGARH